MPGIRIDKRRERETADVELVTPHGTEITVTKSRAEALLARSPIAFGDGVFRKYVTADSGDSNEVAPAQTRAAAPRKGSGANSGGE
jgi:hypothetical protein